MEMNGSIYRRKDGRWCAAVVIGRTESGKTRRKVVYGRTRQDVAGKLKRLHVAKAGNAESEATQETVAEFLLRWLDEAARPRLRATSYDVYETVVRLHVLPYVGADLLTELNPASVQGFDTRLETAGVTLRNRQHVHMILHKAFGQAVKWELLSRNPCDGVVIPKGGSRPIVALTADQVRALLEAAKRERLYALYALAVASSARLGELLALEWPQVDFTEGTVSIMRSLASVRGRKSLGDVKSPASRRKIELPQFALQVLWEHKARMEAEGYDGSFVFVNKAHNLIDKGNVYAWSFKPLLERAGLPRSTRFHDLRHSGISLLLSQGISLKVVSVRAGHASPNVTGSVYAHVLPGMGREAADRLDSLFSGVHGANAASETHS